ncbi:MAG: transposase [Nitrospinae bacterium]|nr:transposase [Nitrospinota bacterium]
MARPLRIEFPGAVYHVTSRGNGKQDIFLNDHDRNQFLAVLGNVISRFKWVCHSYCLMSNHYHLLIETPSANLSKGMRQLNGVYTQAFNRRHSGTGHLLQGRFKAIVVEKDSHLKELCRYVVLNPVRAKMVNHPAKWKWSAYGAAIGVAPRPEWLFNDWILSQFGSQRKRAVKAYANFVREGEKETPNPWENMIRQSIIGTESFILKVLGRVSPQSDLSEIPRNQRLHPPKPLVEILLETGSKKKAMVSAYLGGGYTLKEIATFLGVHYTTVSRVVKKGELG